MGERVWASLARGLAGRSAGWRAALLGAVSEPVRDGLIERWIAAASGRGELADLGEIEVRLHRAGIASGRLAGWADGLGRLARRHVESALAGRELAADWRALRRRGA